MQRHYQYPDQGIPTEYQTIAKELQEEVKQVRQQYIPPRNRKTLKGNVAVAKLEILSNPNHSYSFEATSQRKPINIPGEEEGPQRWFDPRLDRAVLGECYNKTHAEYKLFNAIAEKIKQSNLPDDVEGILYLYTERDTCSGCYSTGDEFSLEFQKITVIIFYERLYP